MKQGVFFGENEESCLIARCEIVSQKNQILNVDSNLV